MHSDAISNMPNASVEELVYFWTGETFELWNNHHGSLYGEVSFSRGCTITSGNGIGGSKSRFLVVYEEPSSHKEIPFPFQVKIETGVPLMRERKNY